MKKMYQVFCICAAFSILCCAQKKDEKEMGIKVTSSAFEAKQQIPSRYTCDGDDISPSLSWENVPESAKSIVIIGDDPDAPAGTWVHWVCYDIPANLGGFEENEPAKDTLEVGGKQGINDFGKIGYGGPCPPGGTHRYFFKVYAVDTMLGLEPGKTGKEIEKAMEGHVLDRGELTGVYSRSR